MINMNNDFSEYESFDLPADFPMMDDLEPNFGPDDVDSDDIIDVPIFDDDSIGYLPLEEDSFEDTFIYNATELPTSVDNIKTTLNPQINLNLEKTPINKFDRVVEVPIYNRIGWKKIYMPLWLKKNLNNVVLSKSIEEEDFIHFNAEVYSCRGDSYHLNYYGYKFLLPKLNDKSMPIKISDPEVYPDDLNLEKFNLHTIHCGYKYKLLSYSYKEDAFFCVKTSSLYANSSMFIEKPVMDDLVYKKRFKFSLEGDFINLWNSRSCIVKDDYSSKMFGVMINLLKEGFPISALDDSESIVDGILNAIRKPKYNAKNNKHTVLK